MNIPTYEELEVALYYRDKELMLLESRIRELETALRQREIDLAVTKDIMNSLSEGV